MACSQFRCRELTKSKIYLYTPNDPIVEASSNLTFAPWNFKYPFLKAHSAENTGNLVGKFTDDNGDVFDKRN